MQLKQQFVVAHPRAIVWDFFGRLDEVTLCMPGASLTGPSRGDLAKFTLNIKLGPIGASFAGEAQVERLPVDFRGIIRGSARDPRGDSRVQGVVEYVLSQKGQADMTSVHITVDFSLSGRLAQFSRAGIVNDLAARLTAVFASNLDAALAATSSRSSTGAPSSDEQALNYPTMQPVRELNADKLLIFIVGSRIKALFKSIFGCS